MSGMDLYLELQGKVSLLDSALRQFGERGRTKAKTEMDYRIALSQKILVEREKGTPVTVISDISRGDRNIAKLKFDRDVAESAYEVAKEALNVYKLEIKVLENQIDREYRG